LLISGTGVQLFRTKIFSSSCHNPVPSPEKNPEAMVKKGRKKSMRTVREILRLHFEHNLSHRAIARACAVSPTTVGEYLERIIRSGQDWQTISALDDSSLKTVLYPDGSKPVSRKPLPDFDYLRLEMKKRASPSSFSGKSTAPSIPTATAAASSANCTTSTARPLIPSCALTHKAGEKLFVDFSGDRPSYIDRETGEVIEPELFVAVMGASSRTFALAVASQQIPDWTRRMSGAFEYYGGVPAVVVPDQLKSGVKTSCKYDPEINPVYAELCAHYGVAVIPPAP
jgi:transposase